MRIKIIGNALLVFAFLLSSAGIVEPSSGLSAATAAFVFIGFFIVTTMSHQDWSAGYRAAQLDMTFVPQDDRQEELADAARFKCGRADCHCTSDVSYREWSDD